MKSLAVILAALGCLAVATPVISTPASAYVVRKSVRVHHGYYGHGCRTVRTVARGYHGKRVTIRKVCR